MRACSRCNEIEQLLERTAREHWNVIHHYRGTSQEVDRDTVARLLAATKAAMDEAQELYNQHLAESHPKAKSG
jgi:hypothetical protein